MNIIVNSTKLLKELSKLSGVILGNPMMPILENFLFSVEGQYLTITASDMQNTFTTQLAVDSDKDADVCIPAKMFLETLKALPEQPITIKANDNNQIEIVAKSGRYRLSGESATDFPLPIQPKETTVIQLSAIHLSSAIAYTLFAVSNDDMKPAMNGVFMTTRNGGLEFVSTDAHKLVRYRELALQIEQPISCILPKKALGLLKNALPQEGLIDFEFTQSNAFFTFGNMKLACRLIDEKFPDYESVIPFGNEKKVMVGKLEGLAVLRRISIFANKNTNLIQLKLKNDVCTVSAEDIDFSNEASEALDVSYSGEVIEIGFGAKILAEVLANIPDDNIIISIKEANKAVLVEPRIQEADSNLLMLVMPVMLGGRY